VTWRHFVREEEVDLVLRHVLTCGHVVEGRCRKSDGLPVARQWCPACWASSEEHARRPADVVLRLPPYDARWLRAVLESGQRRGDFDRDDCATRVMACLDKTLQSD
jgi:hypothetical protein